jgi:hypothetical protein
MSCPPPPAETFTLVLWVIPHRNAVILLHIVQHMTNLMSAPSFSQHRILHHVLWDIVCSIYGSTHLKVLSLLAEGLQQFTCCCATVSFRSPKGTVTRWQVWGLKWSVKWSRQHWWHMANPMFPEYNTNISCPHFRSTYVSSWMNNGWQWYNFKSPFIFFCIV